MFFHRAIGKFIVVIPKIVITVFLVSLVECLFILPAHLAASGARPGKEGWLERRVGLLREWVARGLEKLVTGPYKRLLELALRARYAALASGSPSSSPLWASYSARSSPSGSCLRWMRTT